MRTHNLFLVLALIGAAATPAAAQETRTAARQAWLGFSYESYVPRGERARLVIREIVENSPASRAGLAVGDTLLRIQDLAATEELVGALRRSLAPGDAVRILVRRDGRDVEYTLVAAERPANMQRDPERIVVFDPDQVRIRLRGLTDSLLLHVDTMRLPRVYVERFRDGQVQYHMGGDTIRSFFVDTVGGGRVFRFYGPRDSMRIRIDSVWSRMGALPRFEMLNDSAGWRVFADTALWRGGRIAVRGMFPDSNFVRFESWPGVTMFSTRAIAGAELTELSPGLARHFNVQRGVLVTRVPAGSNAEGSGILEADVIVTANGKAVGTVAELREAVMRAGVNQPVSLEVVRDGKRMTLELKR